MSLAQLVALVFTYNAMTFGNGPMMVPLLNTSLVEESKAITNDQLLYAFTVARVTPGQANTYVASVGYMMFGWVGALACTLAIMLPGYLMIPLLDRFERIRGNKTVEHFTRGLTTTSVGLILAATYEIGLGTLISPVAWMVFGAALVFLYFLKWGPIPSLVAASVVGLVLNSWL